MELKDFIKKVLTDLVESVEEVRQTSQRDIHLIDSKNERTVEFDIAVTVENTTTGSGKAGIKVLHLIEGGGALSKEIKNSSVSRIKFGVHVDRLTKEEKIGQRAKLEARNSGPRKY